MPAVQKAKSTPPSFETVWAALQEVAARQEETARQMQETDRKMQETDRQIQETARQMQETDRKMQETDRQMQETARQMQETDRKMQETARQMQETDRKIEKSNEKIDKYDSKVKELSKSFGRAIEYMVTPNLRTKLREFKLDFPRANSNTEVDDYTNDIHFEIDVMLENGDKAMLVEVKTKLTTEDVKEHIERMEKMRQYADLHGDKRAFLGAVAGVVITTNVKNFALKKGFYVIEPSGETFNIIPPSNKPKEW